MIYNKGRTDTDLILAHLFLQTADDYSRYMNADLQLTTYIIYWIKFRDCGERSMCIQVCSIFIANLDVRLLEQMISMFLIFSL